MGAAVLVVLVVSVALRLHTTSALWLDEAQSVAIARLPVRELLAALRTDGSPPLYYLLLHIWMLAFGTETNPVRLLSALASVLSLPVLWWLVRRLRDRSTAWAAVLLLATNPFAVRYASEARMYALLVLLVLLLALAVSRALERSDLPRLLAVAVLTGLVLLTHYWGFFAVGMGAALLLRAAVARRGRGPAERCLLAGLAGSLLFLPWVASFLYQASNTGTPWAGQVRPTTLVGVLLAWSGGSGFAPAVLYLLLVGLGVLALVGRAGSGADGRPVALLRLPTDPVARQVALATGGALLLGLLVTRLTQGGFAARYSSVAFPGAVLLAALGAAALPSRGRNAVLAVALASGLAAALGVPGAPRTQAASTAALIETSARPDDLVVFCPDQLGPANHRLLPASVRQVVYPTLGPADRVDWVGYAQRNAAADPAVVAGRIAAQAPGNLWLVYRDGYRTFDRQCSRLATELAALRGRPQMRQRAWQGPERQNVLEFRSAAAASARTPAPRDPDGVRG